MHADECRQFVGFVPQAGHTYSVRHMANRSACEVRVIDNATGEAPPTLQRLQAGVAACQAYLGEKN